MSEKNNNNQHLLLKDLISESLLRDLILFTFFFLLLITQSWDNILLLLFPLITSSFSFFFRILNSNKKRTKFENNLVIYNPLGLEGKNADRLFFCTLFQLVLIFWIGAQSLYDPLIVNSYKIYFIGFLVFFYTFGFFWIFIDLWKYIKIEIIPDGIEDEILDQTSTNFRNTISLLKLKNFKLTSLITLIIFLILNLLNLVLNSNLNDTSILGISLYLPGSQLIVISYVIYAIIIIPPVLSIILLAMNCKAINNFSREKLERIIESLPKNLHVKIIENLKALNKKIRKQLNLE